ncbi:hypothetical protein BGM19_23855 [Streptomyces agglomeratus]|uniref:Uncharacterized protein n=1 Tax=Streptomyces agglomeratus TaxID=285458 RepID=A0A1E5P7A1_9ACTN|nr:hypothetical protein [Streptomyces agglomeratus]OEJ25264.1 hypothetical protein AS594_12955 [Streptomyces agglomeratus]OEJ53247.1 hypothetical protein BGK72_23145 [Streptomyces agglomeratus]OEJ60584.1 hypothetical protein BGM19_23855 [Streptomyces agglomeratus]
MDPQPQYHPQPQQGFGPPPPAFAPAPAPMPYSGPGPAPAPHSGPGPAPTPYAGPVPPAGPDFLAADRRNAVVVDAEGVSLESNGATLDFPWRDLATVHYKPGPGGEVLMVAVALPDGRFYEGVVVARNRAKLQEWLAQLGPVLAHYLAGRGH